MMRPVQFSGLVRLTAPVYQAAGEFQTDRQVATFFQPAFPREASHIRRGDYGLWPLKSGGGLLATPSKVRKTELKENPPSDAVNLTWGGLNDLVQVSRGFSWRQRAVPMLRHLNMLPDGDRLSQARQSDPDGYLKEQSRVRHIETATF